MGPEKIDDVVNYFFFWYIIASRNKPEIAGGFGNKVAILKPYLQKWFPPWWGPKKYDSQWIASLKWSVSMLIWQKVMFKCKKGWLKGSTLIKRIGYESEQTRQDITFGDLGKINLIESYTYSYHNIHLEFAYI